MKRKRRAPRNRKKPVTNPLSVQNIKRIDSPKTHGWQVHVRRGGVLRTKLFSDRQLGGKSKALAAAKKYRNSLVKEMQPLAKPLWLVKRTPRSNTGHLGISYTETKTGTGRKKKTRAAITVTVRESLGNAVNRKFSVDKLGYDAALKKAVAWRNKILRERAKSEKVKLR
ncbi:MAG: hypothetical protein AAF591_23130 [Verrucomicrobiota bacterium]